MISYSTNWMGPVSMDWYRSQGLTRIVERTITNKIIAETLKIKVGDTVPREEATVDYAGGRIDVYGTDEPFNPEISLPIMEAKSWNSFSKWLDTYHTETVKTLNEILTDYYAEGNDPIVWWKDEESC